MSSLYELQKKYSIRREIIEQTLMSKKRKKGDTSKMSSLWDKYMDVRQGNCAEIYD